MDDTRELVNAADFARWLALGSGVCLALFAVSALLVARGPGAWRAPGRRLAYLAGVGALVWPLWRLYDTIVERMGLDSVAALGINLGIFVLVGLVLGLIARRLAIFEGEPAPEQAGQEQTIG